MPDITVHPAYFVPLDDTPQKTLAAALTAFASSPDDVRVAAGYCLDAVAAALAHCIRRRLRMDNEFENEVDWMDASLDDFNQPDGLARNLTDLLYVPVELAAVHLDLTPPPRMREAIACALARGFRQDADLLPFQAWTLAHALHEAVQAGSTAIATACLADLRALALAPPRDGEDPRYRHELNLGFMSPNGEDEDDDEAPFPDDIEIISDDDPAIPLESALHSTAAARARLARLVARQQAPNGPGALDGAGTALLAACIATARDFLAHTEAWNDSIRQERVKRLN